MRSVVVAACAVFMLGVTPRSDDDGVRLAPDGSVYAAVLGDHYPDGLPAVIIVEDQAIGLPSLAGADPDSLRMFEGVPAPLLRAIDDVRAESPLQFAASQFPPQTWLIAKQTLNAHFTPPSLEQWATFPQVFGADRWHAFSQVLTIPDGLDALVYHEHYCGGLCGEGVYVWLHRESPEAKWVIRTRTTRWIA